MSVPAALSLDAFYCPSCLVEGEVELDADPGYYFRCVVCSFESGESEGPPPTMRRLLSGEFDIGGASWNDVDLAGWTRLVARLVVEHCGVGSALLESRRC